MIDLSVIIVTYNTCDLTRRCLLALTADDPSPFTVEIIVVDNGSTDATSAILPAEFPTVRLLQNQRNEGFARGNNVGLAAAAGRYLMLLNSDTEVLPGALRSLITFMDAHPAVGACGPMLLNPDGSLQPSGRKLPTLWSVFQDMTKLYQFQRSNLYAEPGRDYNQPKQVEEVSGAAFVVRRAVYAQVGGLDPAFFAYYEDVDWCKRIGDAGWSIYYAPDARVVHLWQGTSRQASARAYAAGQDSLRYYFAKHHGWASAFVIQALLVGKELLRIISCLIRCNRDGLAFHWKMLRNALTPLRSAA